MWGTMPNKCASSTFSYALGACCRGCGEQRPLDMVARVKTPSFPPRIQMLGCCAPPHLLLVLPELWARSVFERDRQCANLVVVWPTLEAREDCKVNPALVVEGCPLRLALGQALSWLDALRVWRAALYDSVCASGMAGANPAAPCHSANLPLMHTLSNAKAYLILRQVSQEAGTQHRPQASRHAAPPKGKHRPRVNRHAGPASAIDVDTPSHQQAQ